MKFDSNRAWQRATAAIRANREVAFALAGVFFLLPSLAFSLLFPQPSPPPGADQAAMMRYIGSYYEQTLPFLLPVAILQAAGTLTLITLLTDRTRPTVGAALRLGFAALLPFLASQVLLGAGLGLALVVVSTVLAAAGSMAAAGLGVAFLLGLAVYVYIRLALVAPVIAVDGVRNPVTALRRSWALTRGNAGRILLFFFLIVLVTTVVLSLVLALVGIVLALVLPIKLVTIVAAVVSATMGAGVVVLLVAVLVATHDQLAGEPASAIGATFD